MGRKRVLSRRAFCACPSCAAPKCDFAKCLVIKSLNHRVANIKFPPADPVGVQRETRSLKVFGEGLEAGDFFAVKVDLDERQLEGDYWIVRLTEPMTVAEGEFNHAGEIIRKGWLVVKGQWLQFIEPCFQGSNKVGRRYKLLQGERFLNISTLVRIDKLDVVVEVTSGTFMLSNEEDERVLNSIH